MDIEGLLAILFFGGGGSVVALAFSPLGRAWADRIRSRGIVHQDPEILEDLNQLRQEVAELHERVDFSERLLAERQDPADRA